MVTEPVSQEPLSTARVLKLYFRRLEKSLFPKVSFILMMAVLVLHYALRPLKGQCSCSQRERNIERVPSLYRFKETTPSNISGLEYVFCKVIVLTVFNFPGVKICHSLTFGSRNKQAGDRSISQSMAYPPFIQLTR